MVLQPVHVMQIADVAWRRVNMGCADVVALQHKAVHAAVLEVIYCIMNMQRFKMWSS